MEDKKTPRGFHMSSFMDLYGSKCSLQKSSLASEDAIWLGVDDASPQIMARDAAKHGIATEKNCGWVSYPIPSDVLLSTRMHLSRDQAKSLLPYLQRFVDTGDLHDREED